MDNVFDIVMITAWVLLYSFLWYFIGKAVAMKEQGYEEKRKVEPVERAERVEAYQMPPGFNSNNRFY